MGAGIGLAEVADDVGLEVVVLGTPAEEAGGGKVLLLDAVAFDSAHLAMMVHPAPFDVTAPPVVAIEWLEISYKGEGSPLLRLSGAGESTQSTRSWWHRSQSGCSASILTPPTGSTG